MRCEIIILFRNNPNFKLSDIMDQIQVMMKQHNIPRATRNYVRKYKQNGPTAFIIGKNNRFFVKGDNYEII